MDKDRERLEEKINKRGQGEERRGCCEGREVRGNKGRKGIEEEIGKGKYEKRII